MKDHEGTIPAKLFLYSESLQFWKKIKILEWSLKVTIFVRILWTLDVFLITYK